MEILQSGVMLQDVKGWQTRRIQVGDVARLASGRLVARHYVEFEDGTRGYGCRDYVPGETPDVFRETRDPINWSRRIGEELNRFPGLYRKLGPHDFVPDAHLEFERFRKEWPHTAAAFGLDAPAARATRFEVGETWYPAPGRIHEAGALGENPRFFLAQGVENWRRWLEQHAAGSFGVYGDHEDVPVTDDELFTLVEQPIVVANKAAVAAKSGPILSRFLLPDTRGARAKGQYPAVDIVTVLAPRGPRTLMMCQYVDAKAAGHS